MIILILVVVFIVIASAAFGLALVAFLHGVGREMQAWQDGYGEGVRIERGGRR